MRKLTLLLAIVALAALTSTADAAKKRKVAAAKPTAQVTDPNENTWRFVRDAFPVFLPSWAIPIYLSQQTEGPHAWNGNKRKDAKNKKVRQARRAQ
jgi:hypothetical protein